MTRSLAILFASSLAFVGAAGLAQPLRIELQFGDVPAELADEPSQIVVSSCSGCHSLDYITTQPRGKGEQFWRDSVTKMVNVYKAPLSPEQADTVAAFLGRKFG